MRVSLTSVSLGIGVLVAAALCGCTVRAEPAGPPPVYSVDEPYYGPHYTQGWYVGNDWHWRDRGGHERFEARAEHERHMNVGREGERGGREHEVERGGHEHEVEHR